MTGLAYWGAMFVIPVAAIVAALSAFVIARAADGGSSARRSIRRRAPAE